MKRLSILTALFVVTLIVSACGAQPTPTAPAVDIEGTMAMAVLTSIAETQAAVPTSTPLPPTATSTNTPEVTATLPVLPTLGATFTAVSGGVTGAEDPCITAVLPAELNGENIRIRIDNPTRAAINVTVYLLQASPGAVCGYRAYTLEPAGSLVINNLVEGCYTIWAWNPDPEEYFMVTNGSSCLNNSNNWTFDVSTSTIRLR